MNTKTLLSTAAIRSLASISIFSCLMLLFRIVWSGSFDFYFLAWNLFLAIVPLILAVPLYKSYLEKKQLGALGAGLLILWLLFFPNAPYIITDLIHLAYSNREFPIWFDALMIFSFAFSGVYAGFLSLLYVFKAISEYLKGIKTVVFTIAVFTLSSYGIYMGRILRWNSWDAFTRPHIVLIDVYSHFSDPHAWGMTAFFSFFMLIAWYVFKSFISVSLKTLIPDEPDQMSEKL